MTAKTANQIDAEAADWAARADRGGLSPGESRQFQNWLAGDVRCPGAYARLRALALYTERAQALGADFDPGSFAPARMPSRAPSRRRVLRIGGAIAATALIGAGGAWQVLRLRGRVSTGKGETKVIALQDGSVVTLNTDSEILVQYSDTVRAIELLHGEALFDVAKHKRRPFVVTAGRTNVRAIGTSFTVSRMDAAPVQVLVREGVVEIFAPATGAPPLRISANTLAEVAQDRAGAVNANPVPVAQVNRQMAWQGGQLAFEGETLAQAAAKFARYSDTRIIIDDPALAREEIAGLFKATDPVGFAHTIAVSLNAQAHIREGEVHLTR